MPSIAEASVNGQSQLNDALRAGLDTIDRLQMVTFVKYVRQILPLDGFVFWVRADLLSSTDSGSNSYNGTTSAQPSIITSANSYSVGGSFHYSTRREQTEEETIERNTITFTSKEKIEEFNAMGQDVMLLADYDGIRFAFSSRKPLYLQADIYHYQGVAVLPALESQIIDDLSKLPTDQIVCNSLPFWLTLNAKMPIYPAYLADNNMAPPYATVYIDPASTEAIQSVPYLDITSNHYQLVKERVKITIYGLTNKSALDYLDYVLQYTLSDSAGFGVMNMPVPKDDKRTQEEMAVIAMKKTIIFDVNYYQTRAQDLARQLITSAFVTDIYRKPI